MTTELIFTVAFGLICVFIVFLFGIMAVGSFYEIKADIIEHRARIDKARDEA